MRILICGNCRDQPVIQATLDSLHARFDISEVVLCTTLAVGHVVRNWADQLAIDVQEFSVRWGADNRNEVAALNRTAIRAGADMVVAFPGATSRARSIIKRARAAGIQVCRIADVLAPQTDRGPSLPRRPPAARRRR